jgi:PRTRC genetic system ThiF family protein
MPHLVAPYLSEDLHDITILLVGAGGNGSFMLSNLARINYALMALGRKGLHVTVCDFDTVSENNVGRQLFAPSDIGKFKSEVLISRANRTFGTNWNWSKRDITVNTKANANIVITAVDNVAARRAVCDTLSLNSNKNSADVFKNYYWLDLGNGKDFGQVILSGGGELKGLFDFYPDLEDEADDGPSCSMMEALAKQDLFINSTLTQFAGKLLYELLTRKELNYQGAYLNMNPLSVKPILV